MRPITLISLVATLIFPPVFPILFLTLEEA